MQINHKQISSELEKIRTTSENIHEVVQRLTKLWELIGIKVVFTSYPSEFTYSVSNSHNAPKGYSQNWKRESDKPEGYPGWTGVWKGTITTTDSKSWGTSLAFRNLIGSWGNKKLPSCTWIKTGTGSSGIDFNISGMLFLYDFPLMHKQFCDNKEEFKVLEKDYNNAIKKYHNKFLSARDNYIKTSPLNITLQELTKELEERLQDLNAYKVKMHNYHASKFCENYKVVVPKMPSMFIDDKAVREFITDTSYSNAIALPELSSTIQHIKSLSEKIENFVNTNPENFT